MGKKKSQLEPKENSLSQYQDIEFHTERPDGCCWQGGVRKFRITIEEEGYSIKLVDWVNKYAELIGCWDEAHEQCAAKDAWHFTYQCLSQLRSELPTDKKLILRRAEYPYPEMLEQLGFQFEDLASVPSDKKRLLLRISHRLRTWFWFKKKRRRKNG